MQHNSLLPSNQVIYLSPSFSPHREGDGWWTWWRRAEAVGVKKI